jgi:small subunit ribosomal protein S3
VGQKVNPIGFRLRINKPWLSRWYSRRKFADFLNEDLKMREYLFKTYRDCNLDTVEIERAAAQITVRVMAAKPGRLIGKQGRGIEEIKSQLAQFVDIKDKVLRVDVNEYKKPDSSAKILSQNLAIQLEGRVPFRRAMKKIMSQAKRSGVKGIKVQVSGRLNGADMSRREWYREGRIPLHTLRSDIDYAQTVAYTRYGLTGVKVWIYKGEQFLSDFKKANLSPAEQPEGRG